MVHQSNMTTLERILLESLERGEKNLAQLSWDTGLNAGVVDAICEEFIKGGLVEKTDLNYVLTKKNGVRAKGAAILGEVEEILRTAAYRAILEEDHRALHLRKIYVSPRDEMFLLSLLSNLEKFVEGIQNKGEFKTCDQKVIYWGVQPYSQIIGSLCSSS